MKLFFSQNSPLMGQSFWQIFWIGSHVCIDPLVFFFSITSFAVVETKKPNGIANGKKEESSSDDTSSDEETDKKEPAKTGKLDYSLKVH